MRICIAYSSLNNKKIEMFARALGKGLEAQSSALIDIVDIDKESEKRLTGFNYILFGSSKTSLFNSKTNKSFMQFLKNCGHLSGKRTYAFTVKGFGSQKYLANFMAEIEKQGVLLKSSAVISSKEEAKIIGSKLHIK